MKFKDRDHQLIINKYFELNSSKKVADYFNVTATTAKRWLRRLNVLRSYEEGMKYRKLPSIKGIKRTPEQIENIRRSALNRKVKRTGYKLSEETKQKIREKNRLRVGIKNSNYRHGKYQRRTRDYKLAEIKPLIKEALKRSNYKCELTGVHNDKLQVHHLIPYRVCPDAYLDMDNLMVVDSKIHLSKCHNGNWNSFNVDIIPDALILKYNFSRERLNELASMWTVDDAIVRTTDITKTVE